MEEINKSIEFLSIYLKGDEWLKIYPLPSILGNVAISVKVGKSLHQSLDFFYDVFM
jgi:uncharacterized membrane protein YfbV (UPF0208 family)